MASELIFLVEDDEAGGYTAHALGVPIFTQGDDLESLRANVKEAVELHYEDEAEAPSVVRLHFVRDEVFAI